jgi:hypothetical protein
VAHGGILIQTCRHLNIASPLVLTPTQVLLNVNECMTWLEGLKKDALKLQNARLRECLSSAQVREVTALVIAIQKILHAESIRRHWQSIRRAANPARGGAVTWLTVPHPAGDTRYATREGVESQGAAAIETQYKVARGAPILQDARLHGNFGFLANTVLADQVLQGSYIYPENMDTHTKLLLQEARHIFHRLSKEEVVDFVLTTDFQSYWQHNNEHIQSFKSGCHFGHYKKVCLDCYLSAVHAAKLTLAASTGIPLACWGNGLAALLKKVFGIIYIDKMWAICLLEANYNWLNKFVFAK